MRIVCQQTILMKYQTFFENLKRCQKLSSAAVVIGALRVKRKKWDMLNH